MNMENRTVMIAVYLFVIGNGGGEWEPSGRKRGWEKAVVRLLCSSAAESVFSGSSELFLESGHPRERK